MPYWGILVTRSYKHFLFLILSEENENNNFKFKNTNICIPIFTVALFTVAKIWKQLKCPLMDEWVKKICTHTHTPPSSWISHQHICEIQIAQLLLTIGHGMEARSNAVKSNIV